jgi:hypothetical protein
MQYNTEVSSAGVQQMTKVHLQTMLLRQTVQSVQASSKTAQATLLL